ncbi:hypothetical protein ACHRVK_03200 [Flavobacterium plurextorum]|uniref:hypothetical protein n=1 Tax=Flavobacterium plurextorum TaxID=1114867 RepID=UPI0037562E83
MKQLLIYNQTHILERIKQLLVLTLLLANSLFISAQQNKNSKVTTSSQEAIFLHTNTTTFLTGETLLYKLYCLNPLNNKPSLVSKIAYIELVDNGKQSFQKNKVYLQKGIGTGDYFIPTTLKTGNYKLIAYTKWMLNNPKSQTFEIDLFIINPFQTQEPNANVTFDNTLKNSVSTTKTSSDSNLDNEKRIELELDKDSYYTRDKANIKVKSLTETIQKGNYSISIRKKDQIPTLKQTTPQEFAKKTASNYSNYSSTSFQFVPELRAELITGSIVSKSNQDLNNKSISMSLPGKEYVLKIVKTNSKGKFTFLLDRFPNFSNAVIQVLDQNPSDFTVTLDPLPNFDTSGLQFSSKLNLTEDLKKDIEERSTASQIQNAYYQIKKDSLVQEAVISPFFNSIEKVYVLDDYTRFPTLKENVVEVITELYYRRVNDKYQLYVRNNKKDLNSYGPPLIIVDGLLIQDSSDLFDYNMANVNKVSLITEPYAYGPNLYGGLISFETKNSDFAVNYVKKYMKPTDVQRPNPAKVYYNPDYSSGNNLKRIPDYRYQLFWEPTLSLDKKEENLSFYTSDLKGDFEVVLEGFTDDGKPVYITKNITVK